MNRVPFLTLASLAVALASCQQSSQAPAEEETTEPAAPSQLIGGANLKLADGTGVGSAEITTSGDQVKLSIAFSDLPPGTHAVHLHTTGSCEAPDFKSAGGHLNPGMKEHGMENPNGAHLGDLPNVTIDPEGNGTLSATLRGTKDEVTSAMFDDDGTAIVVHSGEDDNKSDPAGNAGDRIACGVVTPAPAT